MSGYIGLRICIAPGCMNQVQMKGRCNTHYRQYKYGLSLPPGVVAVTCWCDSEIVFIPSEDVGKRTESCGQRGCHA